MSQLTFKFPFKTTYSQKDFYVSSNNFAAYRLIEDWPNWSNKWININGPSGCGKSHLANILKIQTKSLYVNAVDFNSSFLTKLENFECLIIDNYKNNIEEIFLYTTLNQINQLNKYIVINSEISVNNLSVESKDLKSRLSSFTTLKIDLPTDDLLRVIISKAFSDKQIELNVRLLEYIIKNIDRSYEKVFKFIKDVDNESLSIGKPININLIKKILNNE